MPEHARQPRGRNCRGNPPRGQRAASNTGTGGAPVRRSSRTPVPRSNALLFAATNHGRFTGSEMLDEDTLSDQSLVNSPSSDLTSLDEGTYI